VIGRQATDRDLQAMLDTLVQTFTDDPVWGGWAFPDSTRSSASEQRELVEIAKGLLGEHADVFLDGCELLEQSHPQGRPHYYLALLGTHNRYRGQGLGMELLRQSLCAIDAAGMPAYLESTSPKNIVRYERLGFGRIGSIQLPAAGPRVELMWREPREPSALR